jgi:hypothetical protein
MDYNEDDDSFFYALDSIKNVTPSIEVGNDYTNKVLFWGRDFGLNQFGFEPRITFKTGKGLYVYASQYYWSALTNPWAKTDFGIGYEKQVTDRIYVSGAYERWIFYNGTPHDQHGLQNYFEFQLNFDFDYFSIEPTAYYMVGNRQIFQTDLVIKGDYRIATFLKTGRVFLQPEVLMTNATSTYFSNVVSSQNNTNSDQQRGFKIVDYEFMLPLTINFKNIIFQSAYHFACPIKVQPNENVHTLSYLTLSLAYTLFLKKTQAIPRLQSF